MGECAGLTWSAMDVDGGYLHVDQVAIETPGEVVIRPCPKTRAGRRTVPMPTFLIDALRTRREMLGYEPDGRELVFCDRLGGALRRSNFRRRVWRPALVRAGLLGKVVETGPYRFWASCPDTSGVEWSAEFTTERDAVTHVAKHASGGLRFHDLRHSYVTWLVSDGVPINAVQRVMGHEQASTTLNRYTHAPADYDDRVRAALDSPAADDPLTSKRAAEPGTTTTTIQMRHDLGKQIRPECDDPRRGEAGVVLRFGSGGVEPNPPGGHGGGNRRGLRTFGTRHRTVL